MVIALTLLIIAVIIFIASFVVIFIGHAIVHSSKHDFEIGRAVRRVSVSALVVTVFFTTIVGVVGLGDPDMLTGNDGDSIAVASVTNGERRGSNGGGGSSTRLRRTDTSSSSSSSSGSSSSSTSRSRSDSSRTRTTSDSTSLSRSTTTTVRSGRSTTTTVRSSSSSDSSSNRRRPDGDSSSGSSSSSGSWSGGGSNPTGADYIIEAVGASDSEVYTVLEKWKYKDSRMRTQKFTVAIELLTRDINAAEKFLKDVDRRLRGDQEDYAEQIGVDISGNDYEDTKNFYIEICREFYKDDRDRFDNIVKGLEKIFSTLGFSQQDKLYFVATMIQNIKYDDPGGEIGIFPATLTLARNFGDCDTKSILAYIILEKLGFDVAIMASEEYSHAMLGVSTTATGKYLTLNGKKYYFLEMTYPDWWLGELASDCNNLRYWYAFKLDE